MFKKDKNILEDLQIALKDIQIELLEIKSEIKNLKYGEVIAKNNEITEAYNNEVFRTTAKFISDDVEYIKDFAKKIEYEITNIKNSLEIIDGKVINGFILKDKEDDPDLEDNPDFVI